MVVAGVVVSRAVLRPLREELMNARHMVEARDVTNQGVLIVPAAQLRSARDMAAGDGAYKQIAIKARKGLLTSALVTAVVVDVTSQIVQEVHAMLHKDALPMVEAKDACMMVADAVLEVLHISA
jgi:hypothetical protein